MGKSTCCSKDSGLNRGAWTAQEDSVLSDYISIHGEGQWGSLPRKAGLKRCGKSCRLRWLNYLRPNIKRGNISLDEKDLIIRLHGLLGNRWSLIAGRLPGRTDNEIKNYWNTHISKSKQLSEKRAVYKPHKRSKVGSQDGHSVPTSTPLKATAVRITKGRNSGNSDNQEMKSMGVGQSMMKSSKSLCELLVDNLIMEDTSASEELDGNEGSMSETLQYLMKLGSADGDLNFSPFDYPRDMRMEDIVSNGDEDKCFMNPTMGEINSDTEHLGDWVIDLQCMNRESMPSFTSLLLECEPDWEREEAGISL
ncbi:hypothetical protein SUGI_1002840 [Cryptomeria japonica]|uniref:transcription factor MYB1 n=1 Tax=Cryptomeria japonica TaxID=3369 RepID=UPI002414CB33|nr:transcription factor MYB1 [Cryptomeria japonica]GLJ47501.1 hypothetical protein SUGI_1002840 [Cryptomeria japonica]